VRDPLRVLTRRAEASRGNPGQRGRFANLYRVLGLRPGADSKRIKSAYVRLIKQVHPDFNAGDTQAEQLTKELNLAYQTLGKPETRAAYDRELALQHTEACRRFLQSMAAGVVVFVMTVGLLFPLATFLERPEQANSPGRRTEAYARTNSEQIEVKSDKGLKRDYAREPSSTFLKSLTTSPHVQQQGYRETLKEAEPRSLDIGVQEGKEAAPTFPKEEAASMLPSEPAIALPVGSAVPFPDHPPRIATAIPAPPSVVREQTEPFEPTISPTRRIAAAKPITWALYRNADLGFALKYPSDVFALGRHQTDDGDRLLTSKDGRALLRIFGIPRTATTLTQYRRSLIAQRYADATFDDTHQEHNWFVLSGRVAEEMFYERVTFSCDGRSIHGWLLVYPRADRSFFDEIVEEMHQTYKYDIGAHANCGQS
jgi:curved DNA-binding protein CbpA